MIGSIVAGLIIARLVKPGKQNLGRVFILTVSRSRCIRSSAYRRARIDSVAMLSGVG